MLENTYTTDVVSAGDEYGCTVVEFDDSVDFTSLEIKLDRVVLLNIWMWETDCSAVVGNNVWNLVLSKDLSLDLAEFEAGLFCFDTVRLEASLDVVKNTEVLAGLFDGNDVLEPKWVTWVSPYSVVNFDIGVFVPADFEALLARESVLESVAQKNREWDAFTQLVGAS